MIVTSHENEPAKMNEKNTQSLIAAAPLLYRNYGKEGTGHSFPRWGFMCGDGWFELLMRLSAKMEAELQADLAAGTRRKDLPQASEIKEKFGLLRFHVSKQPALWREWIDGTEKESGAICEICGAPGSLHLGAGVKTVCEACAKRGGWKPVEKRVREKAAPSLDLEARAAFVSARPLLLLNPRSPVVEIAVSQERMPAVERMADRMEAELKRLVDAGQSMDELPIVLRIWLEHGRLSIDIEPESFLDLPGSAQAEFDAALTEASGI